MNRLYNYADAIFEIDDRVPSLSVTNKLAIQLANMKDMRVLVKDDVIEVDLRDGRKNRPTYICAHLSTEHKEQLTQLLKEFISYFAWDYTKMSRPDRIFVEHRILLKPSFKPYK
ncbi:hypothetical protein ACH5RR_006685 [Cinchona calisaya]|uniref:Uncharacterized protein n=1 Tax=Cinchona calisaya TaxID=153742 RepID=A0ABD3AQ46_9GENT